ncbi:hypothetical protein [Kaistia adipata]|uniref:hypothetical protein n=1 Tax=Kaistia adipata TaxID=166954 RepID=UPI00041EAB72|nr:hypothetical protein [Kaistia adipata]
MDPNELVVILERAIANLPDPSADGRRRVYERVEKTIRNTCTSADGVLDNERYRELRRDLGTAIATIEKQARVSARTNIHPQAVAAPAPPPPAPALEPSVEIPPPLEYSVEAPARRWVKPVGIGVLVLALLLGGAYAVLPGGPLGGLVGGDSAPAQPEPKADSVAGAAPDPATPPAPSPAPEIAANTTAPQPEPANPEPAPEASAFAPAPAEPGVPRVTDVKVAILNGASAWRVEPLSGFDADPDGAPVMAVAQDKSSPLLVSLYCDTPELMVFRVAFGADPDTLRRELAERGQLDGVQRQRIQVKTDRNEGFAGDFLALTQHSWGIRLAPDNIETLRAGKEIEISVNDSPTGTVSLSGATPAIDEALAGASCR